MNNINSDLDIKYHSKSEMVALDSTLMLRGGSLGTAPHGTKRRLSRRFLCAAAALTLVNAFATTRYISAAWSGKGADERVSPSSQSRRRPQGENANALATPDALYNSGLKLNYRCLSSSSELRDLIAAAGQAMILMPAKAAGTSLKDFAKACNVGSYGNLMDNFLNFDLEHVLTNSLQMPRVIASHMYHVDNLIYMIKNAPRSTLVVYVHRVETERLLSAINEVVTNWCRRGNGHPGIRIEPPENFFYRELRKTCYVSESSLMEVIKRKDLEIGIGATELLPCETFEAIRTSAPNMVFADYREGNELQRLLAEKYCPHLANKPVESNIALRKEWEAFVRLENGRETKRNVDTIPLRSWLKAKRDALEWSLGLNLEATCRARARIMEDELFSCQSGFLSTRVAED